MIHDIEVLALDRQRTTLMVKDEEEFRRTYVEGSA